MKKITKQHVEQMRKDTVATLEKIRKSPGYAEVAAELDHEYEVARAMEKARKQAKLTQSQIAERMGTTQSAVSRMATSNVTIESLARYFQACGAKLKISALFS
jgi:predicted XRE-type DNA-binding protein